MHRFALSLSRRGPRRATAATACLAVAALVLGLVASFASPASAAPGDQLTWSAPRAALNATTGGMTDVSCPTTTWCLAVDRKGNLLAGAKGTWTAPRKATGTAAGASFTSVSCPSTTFCMTTDAAGRAIPYRDGTWGTPTQVSADRLDAVDCVDASFCAAVDRRGAVATWDGSAWGAARPLIGGFSGLVPNAVSCASRALCVAVNTDGVSARFDATTRTVIDTPLARSVAPDTLSCPRGGSTCVVVSDHTYRLAGSSWVVQSDSTPPVGDHTVRCASARRCIAAYIDISFNTWLVSTFDGTTWATQTVEVSADEYNPAGNAVLACTAKLELCELVSSTQESWSTTPGTWAETSLIDPDNTTVVALSCPDARSCVIAGDRVVTGRDGAGWTPPTAAVQSTFGNNTVDRNLYDVSCGAPGSCSLSGRGLDDVEDDPLLFLTDGRSVRAVPGTGAKYVSCPSAGFCAGIAATHGFGDDYRTTAATYSLGTWSRRATLPNGPASSISCTSSTFCLAVGTGTFYDGDGDTSYGTAYYRYDGSTWTLHRATIAGPGTAKVSCASPTFCVATGTDGRASVYNGRTWSAPKRVTATLDDVDCASTTFCVAAANIGQVVAFDGRAWGTPRTVDTVALADVSCPTTRFCAAADTSGRVVYARPVT